MMSSTNEEDPFLQVQADVLAQLSTTRSLFTSYLRIRSLQSTSPNNAASSSTSTSTAKPTASPELLSAHSELESSLESLVEDLADLVESVKAVQDDPYKYGLEIEEVSRRKRLVDEVGNEVEDMREELAKVAHLPYKPNGGPGASSGMGDSFGNTGAGEEDHYNEFEQEQQLHMLREQDTQLDGVFRTVGNLRHMADDMGRELEEQAEILEHVDGLTDRVGARLQGGLKKMGTVIRRNEDGLSSCCIGVLIFVLILLLILVLVL